MLRFSFVCFFQVILCSLHTIACMYAIKTRNTYLNTDVHNDTIPMGGVSCNTVFNIMYYVVNNA